MIVDLLPNEDQTMIADNVRAALAHLLAVDRLHDETNYGGVPERQTWGELCKLGLFGLGLPEAEGGIGYSPIEEAIVAREYGRHLISLSVVATMLAAHVAAAAGDAALVAALVNGETRAAIGNAIGSLDAGRIEAQLIDADESAHILLWDGKRCILTARSAATASRRVPSIDDAITLDRVEIDLTGAKAAGEATACHAALLVSAYLVGIAGATRDMAVEYAKVREQFGQPIGAFQAIKHACADMAVREEAAFSQTFFAIVAGGAKGGALPLDVASARLLATQAAIENAKANIQVHGAMGFTFECDAHLYLKRAHLLAVLNGAARLDQATILAWREPNRH